MRSRPEIRKLISIINAEKLLNWKPTFTFKGIEQTIQFIEKHPNFYKINKYEI